MVITDEIIKKIAHLARLELSEKEQETYKDELSSILGYFDSLSQVDISGTEAISQVTGLENISREDIVNSFENKKGMLDIAPATSEDGSYLVKNVL